MSTFIGNVFGFALIVWLAVKFVVPLIRRLMVKQQEAVRTQLEESATATQRLAAADEHHAERVEEGRVDARHVVEEARSDSVRITEQLRAQADVEAERIKVQGGQQISLLRSQTLRQLRSELGSESVRRASEIVRAHVSDPQARAATVDRFIDELEAMAPAAFTPEIGTSGMRSSSRDAQSALVERFTAMSGSLTGEQLSTLASELVSVDALLLGEPILARHLAEATGETAAKQQMLSRLLAGKVGANTLEILNTAVSVRWSRTADLGDAVEHIARLALLVRAEQEGQADEVAEQLFRFGRILNAQPRLSSLLGDYTQPAQQRITLLGSVLDGAGGVNPTAAALLTQTVELLRGERADDAVQELAELAVAHRGEIVAEVAAAAELTDAQRRRLTEVLSRIYHHPVSVQLNVDPELLGGLSVEVGDEVIDGTLSARLAAAEIRLPD